MGRPTRERVNSVAVSVMEFQRSSKMSVSSLEGGRRGFEHPIIDEDDAEIGDTHTKAGDLFKLLGEFEMPSQAGREASFPFCNIFLLKFLNLSGLFRGRIRRSSLSRLIFDFPGIVILENCVILLSSRLRIVDV